MGTALRAAWTQVVLRMESMSVCLSVNRRDSRNKCHQQQNLGPHSAVCRRGRVCCVSAGAVHTLLHYTTQHMLVIMCISIFALFILVLSDPGTWEMLNRIE